MRLQFTIFAIIFFFASSNAEERPESKWLENGIEHRVSKERLNACPKWNPGNGKEPPCSAGLALRIANKHFSGPIYNPDRSRSDYKWWFKSMSLVKLAGHNWAWKATYEFWPRSGRRMGMTVQRSCWILMDGKIVDSSVPSQRGKAEQDGADQPATAPKSKPEGDSEH